MIFVSRHEATHSQAALADKAGFQLIHVGDVDAFAPNLAGFQLVHVGDVDAFAPNLADQLHALVKEHGASGVACVHPLVALEAMALISPNQTSRWFRESLTVGVFANENRGGAFVASSLSTFAMNYAVEEAAWSSPTRKNFTLD